MNNYNNNQDIKLNTLILYDILPFLLYRCKFQRFLELSLISKSTFKSVQNYVTHKQNEIKFYPKYSEFINYIKSTTNIEKDNNKFKLLKFNELTNLYLKIKDKERCLNSFKEELIKYCGNSLIKVYIIDYCSIDTTNLNPTFNGFYQINKLYTYWDKVSPPVSNDNEINNDDDDQDDININININNDNYEYSFEFLNRINPIKFKFSTTSTIHMAFHLSKLNNILNCKSLESIKFSNHNTIYNEFIVYSILSKSPQIKELTIRPISGLLSDCFNKSKISNNKSLLKLILKRQLNVKIDTDDINDPYYTLEQLIGNTSLRILGLELYELTKQDHDYKLLSPLIQIPNKNEIHCDLDSVLSFLIHCNQNSNIKILHIKNCKSDKYYHRLYEYDRDYRNSKNNIDSICQYFSTTFIKENQTLKYIKITDCYELYDKLIEILNQSNNNNNNNLIIKKYKNKN